MAKDLPGVASITRESGEFLLTIAEGGQPQAILQRIAATCAVEHFEVIKPTLHDIFVDIARPVLATEATF